jgi:ankyrin repeat protein
MKGGWTALHWAATTVHSDAIRALIAAGSNLDAVEKVRCTLSLQCAFDAEQSEMSTQFMSNVSVLHV